MTNHFMYLLLIRNRFKVKGIISVTSLLLKKKKKRKKRCAFLLRGVCVEK